MLFIFEESLVDDFFSHLFGMNDVKSDVGMFWWTCGNVDIKVLKGLFWSLSWFFIFDFIKSLKSRRDDNVDPDGSENLMFVESDEDILRKKFDVVNYCRVLIYKQLLNSSKGSGTRYKPVQVNGFAPTNNEHIVHGFYISPVTQPLNKAPS